MQFGFSEEWNSEQYKKLLEDQYCSAGDKEMTLKGFKQYFEALIREKGEPECVRALQILGFDKNLVLTKQKTIGIVIQSNDVVNLEI